MITRIREERRNKRTEAKTNCNKRSEDRIERWIKKKTSKNNDKWKMRSKRNGQRKKRNKRERDNIKRNEEKIERQVKKTQTRVMINGRWELKDTERGRLRIRGKEIIINKIKKREQKHECGKTKEGKINMMEN